MWQIQGVAYYKDIQAISPLPKVVLTGRESPLDSTVSRVGEVRPTTMRRTPSASRPFCLASRGLQAGRYPVALAYVRLHWHVAERMRSSAAALPHAAELRRDVLARVCRGQSANTWVVRRADGRERVATHERKLTSGESGSPRLTSGGRVVVARRDVAVACADGGLRP